MELDTSRGLHDKLKGKKTADTPQVLEMCLLRPETLINGLKHKYRLCHFLAIIYSNQIASFSGRIFILAVPYSFITSRNARSCES